MTATSHILGLFGAISALDPEGLARLLRERDVIAPAGASPLDLAALAASPAAVHAQLQLLSRNELDALAKIQQGQPANSIGQHTLLTIPGEPVTLRPEVDAVWEEVDSLLDSGGGDQAGDSLTGPVTDVDITAMVGTVEALEELLTALQRRPLDSAEFPSAETWAARLEPETADGRSWAPVAELAWRCGLIVHRGLSWPISARGSHWRSLALGARLATLAQGVFHQLPGWLAEQLDAASTGVSSPPLPPLVSEEVWSHWTELASRAGLIVASHPTALAVALSRGEDVGALIDQALPNPTDQLYPDGPDSVVAAGVPVPALEEMLRRVGRWDSGGLAPRFVISPTSIVGALQEGVDPDEIHRFVGSTIPGGSASALGHLVADATDKALRVSVQPGEEGSRLVVGDDITAQLLVSDRRLASLSLQRHDGGQLRSSREPAEVHRVLLDEGYPHLVRTIEGALVDSVTEEPVDSPAVGSGWSVDTAAGLVAHWQQLRENSPAEWCGPVIDLAIESGGAVEVTVDMGDNHAVLQLELRSVGNGRLRARDIRSDVEKTIPVNRIVSISPGLGPAASS